MKKNIIKITRLTILLIAKETWLLFRNLLGLVYHPFLTLRRIRQEKDKSQALLMIGTIISPGIIVMTINFIIYLGLRFMNLQLSTLVKNLIIFSNLYIFMLTATAVFYLLYWTYQVIKKNHYQLFVKEK
jgi:hypothetical protein